MKFLPGEKFRLRIPDLSGSGSGCISELQLPLPKTKYRFHRFRFQLPLPLPLPHPWCIHHEKYSNSDISTKNSRGTNRFTQTSKLFSTMLVFIKVSNFRRTSKRRVGGYICENFRTRTSVAARYVKFRTHVALVMCVCVNGLFLAHITTRVFRAKSQDMLD